MLGSRICHASRYYLHTKERKGKGRNQMKLKVESMYLVACLFWCSFVVVVVILFLLSLSLVSLKSSSSLPSYSCFVQRYRSRYPHVPPLSRSALLSFLDPITSTLIGLTKATLSRLLSSPSWSLSQWPIVIALQNFGQLISAYPVSEKVAK